MVDFGGGLVIADSYRIPWLIWIQMLVFFLLLLLLFALDIFSSDLSNNNSSFSSSVAATSTSRASVPPACVVRSNERGRTRSMKEEITQCTTRRGVRLRGESRGEGEGCSSSAKETRRDLHHPCNLFQIAGSAFLKCLGFDRTSPDDPRTP